SARPAHAREFRRHKIRSRCKHRCDQTCDYIELAILIGQRFGIAFFERDVETLSGRARPRFLEPVSRDVAADNSCARSRRDQGELSGAAADIKQADSRRESEPLEKLFGIFLHKT